MTQRRHLRLAVLGLPLFAWIAAACVSAPPAPQGGIPIGVLLPYSGSSAAEGPGAEPGLIMATEMLNQAGGVSGQQFRLIIRDPYANHADVSSIVSDMRAVGVVAIIGPDEVDVATQVQTAIGSAGTYVLPGSVTLRDITSGGSPNVYQIAPPAEVIACALSYRAYVDGRTRLVFMNTSDAYSSSFASAGVTAFASFMQGQLATATSIALDQGQGVTAINQAAAFNPDGVAVVAPVAQAAGFVGDWVSSGHNDPWYLSPTLATSEFVLNTPPNALNGAETINISPSGDSTAFATAYSQRWSGEQPAIDAYFYFDAAILVGLATIAGATHLGRLPTSAEIAPFIFPIAVGPGTQYTWEQLASAIQTLQAGQGINYTGASGTLTLDPTTHALSVVNTILQLSTLNGETFTPGDVNLCPVGTPLGL